MTNVIAHLRHYHVSPRKVRILSDVLKGQTVAQAMTRLMTVTKRSAPALVKLLRSAAANAKHNFKLEDSMNLRIAKFSVDEGPTMKRFRPRARGSASPIRKRTSHVTIVLTDGK